MRTIFIIVDSGAAIRNILRTDVLAVLKAQPDLRLVIFSPLADEAFRQEFEGGNVIIEPTLTWKPNLMVKMVRSLKKDLWGERTGIFTFINHRQRKVRGLLQPLIRKVFGWLSARENIDTLELCERLEKRFTPLLAEDIFDKYRPDLVFYTSLYSKNPCIEIGALQRGVKSICFIHSWDNPTSKGPFPFRPDKVMVWNEVLPDEVVQYHDVSRNDIFVSGVPQFDIYHSRQGYLSKEQFFIKWGLDPGRKLITYTTGDVGILPDEYQVVEMLYDAMMRDSFAYPCQLLVRPHPKDNYDLYKKFEGLPLLTIQRPGRLAATNDNWNPTREEMNGLGELMWYSDVVINTASTITIDAACFDSPVINVAFDGPQNKPFIESCRRFYDFEHYQNIVNTGGVKVAYSLEELVTDINIYLDNPNDDANGRERIRQEQCWKLDGKSGERIANYILEYLHA